MDNLLRFLLKISSLLFFLFLETVALLLVIDNNRYHRSSMFSTSNVISGGVLSATNWVSSYFNLRSENDFLAKDNLDLRRQIADLEGRLSLSASIQPNDSVSEASLKDDFKRIEARVVGNSVSRLQNYITLNVGSTDGVSTDMGVVGVHGVVGTVATVSGHYCVVLPIINPLSRTSCRLDSCRNIGSLVWDGADADYAYLEEIPRHAQVSVGESVVTSGFSDIFPEGIAVGVVESFNLSDADNFYTVKVKLATDYRKIRYVDVISNPNAGELREIESEIESGK